MVEKTKAKAKPLLKKVQFEFLASDAQEVQVMKIQNLETRVIGPALLLILIACRNFGGTRNTAVSCRKWRIHLIYFRTQVRYAKRKGA